MPNSSRSPVERHRRPRGSPEGGRGGESRRRGPADPVWDDDRRGGVRSGHHHHRSPRREVRDRAGGRWGSPSAYPGPRDSSDRRYGRYGDGDGGRDGSRERVCREVDPRGRGPDVGGGRGFLPSGDARNLLSRHRRGPCDDARGLLLAGAGGARARPSDGARDRSSCDNDARWRRPPSGDGRDGRGRPADESHMRPRDDGPTGRPSDDARNLLSRKRPCNDAREWRRDEGCGEALAELPRVPRRYSPLPLPLPPPPARRSRGPLLTAFGDSFVGPLKLLNSGLVISNKIKGGSAVGVSRAKSSTNSQEVVLRELDSRLPQQILLCFGTVDLQTNYFYKLRNGLIPPLKFAEEAAKNYIGFISEHLLPRAAAAAADSETGGGEGGGGGGGGGGGRYPPRHLRRIFVMNAFLPTIPDHAFARGFFKYSNAELEVDTSRDLEIGKRDAEAKAPEAASLDDDRPRPPPKSRDDGRPKPAFSGDDRPDLTRFYTMEIRLSMAREFNRHLRTFCAGRPDVLHFCDVNRHLVDPETGLVAAAYRDTVDPTNIHIIWETSIFHWIDEMPGSGLTHADISDELEQSLQTYKMEKGERIKKRLFERNI